MAICLCCGKEWEPSRNSYGKYCSNKCQKQYERKEKFKLVEEGLAPNEKWVKRYLLEKHGNTCMDPECAWDFSKRTVEVELEHKDGNSNNNTLENCILLCPCCHSLTPTYKNKNKGKGRKKRMDRYNDGKSW